MNYIKIDGKVQFFELNGQVMEHLEIIVASAIGFCALVLLTMIVALVRLYSRERYRADQVAKEKEAKISQLQQENTVLRSSLVEKEAVLTQERKNAEEKIALLNEAKKQLTDTFKALSSDVLKNNSESFLQLATAKLEKIQEKADGTFKLRQNKIDELVKPIKSSLDQVNEKIQQIEKVRSNAYVSLTEQVKSLATSQTKLQYGRSSSNALWKWPEWSSTATSLSRPLFLPIKAD